MKKLKSCRKIMAVLSAAALIAVSAAGCGTSSAASGTASADSASTESSSSEDSNVKYGQVTAVDGSTVTLNMGTMSSGGMGAPSGDNSGTTSGNTPPSMPSGDNSGTTSGNTPPSMPSGDNSGTTSGNTPPSMPSGGNSGTTSGNTPPSMPSGDNSGTTSGDTSGSAGGQNAPGGGQGGMGSSFIADGTTATITISDESIISVENAGTTSTGSLSDISVDSILKLEYDTDGTTLKSVTVMQTGMGGGTAPGGTGNGTAAGGTTDSSSESADLTGATTVDGQTQTIDSQTLSSTNADENTLLVTNSGTATVTNSTLTKSGDTSSADNSNFTGQNAVLCAQAGSTVKISDSKLTSDSEGSNAIFATGDNAKITADSITISTSGDSSRGLDATYGGTIDASNVSITTTGAHCAPIATDRGGGTVTVDKGTLSASGDGSPCIYSTGDITVTNVTGTATGSQCLCVEGKNSVTITKCDLTGAGENGVMLYQSTSGDADEGTALLSADSCSLTTTSDGPMFYITNTQAEIDLTNTVLNFGSGTLISCSGNDTNNWGTSGSNGGTLTVKASSQTLKGVKLIACDAISSVALALSDSSSLTGAVDNANTGDCSVTLDSTSSWTLTSDSYVTSLTDSDTSCKNITSNGHTIYYDSTNEANSWLNGQTITLSDGGTIAPMA